jgi:hypothetical protein
VPGDVEADGGAEAGADGVPGSAEPRGPVEPDGPADGVTTEGGGELGGVDGEASTVGDGEAVAWTGPGT